MPKDVAGTEVTGEKLTRESDLPLYVRVTWSGDELVRGSSVRVLHVIQEPWRQGAPHAGRYVLIGLLAMGMLGSGFVGFASGSPGFAAIAIALAFLMAFGTFAVAVNRSVLVLNADGLTLRSGLIWKSDYQYAFDDPVTVRAKTTNVDGEHFYCLEVIVGLRLAHWGDFESLDDAMRVAAFVEQEVDVRQGGAPAMSLPA